MRTIKRLTATFLSLLMVMMMIVPVHAAESYSITITNDQDGHTYEAYQIFAGTVDSDAEQGGNDPGPVLSNITWSTALEGNAETILTALKNSSNDALKKRFASVETSEASAVAAALQGATTAELEAFADIINGYLGTTPTGSTSTKSSNAYTISGLPAGYYLVKDKENAVEGDPILATKYIIQVLGNVTMQPKSTGDIPTVEKKVYEEDYDGTDYGTGFSEVADHEIGETFTFKLIGSIPTGISEYTDYTYIFHDTMSKGLSLAGTNGDFKVYLSTDMSGDNGTQLNENYTVDITTGAANNSFSVSVDLNKISNISAYQYVIVTYSAQLNNDAVIGSKGNPNEVYLEFSNNPTNDETGKTADQYVVVYAWTLNVAKVDGDAAQSERDNLAGVKFVLLDSTKEKVALINNGGADTGLAVGSNILTGWHKLTKPIAEMTVQEWEDIANAVQVTEAKVDLSFNGLDAGTYYLHEIETLTGYNLLDAPVKLTIKSTLKHGEQFNGTNSMLTNLELFRDDSTIAESCTFANLGKLNITIANYKGALLPETGGMGTTIFYVVGGLLVVGAGVVLIVRLRMRSSDSDHSDE